jgi:hypothetical protein
MLDISPAEQIGIIEVCVGHYQLRPVSDGRGEAKEEGNT